MPPLAATLAVGLTFFSDARRGCAWLSFSDCLFFLIFLDFLNGITLVKRAFFALILPSTFFFVATGHSKKSGAYWTPTICLNGNCLYACLTCAGRWRNNSGGDNEIIGVDSICGRHGRLVAA